MRSLLVVPVADGAAVAAAGRCGADALVLHLGEDAEATRHGARQAAVELMRAASAGPRRPRLFVRLAALDGPCLANDLAAIVPGRPDGILLADARTGADVQHLGAKLAVAEAEHGLPVNAIRILAEAGGSAAGLLGLGSYAGASPRLMALSWHAGGLAAELGGDAAALSVSGSGPFETARHLTLLAARAAGVAAIDTAMEASADDDFLAECRRARRCGYDAKLATTPVQVDVIRAVFGGDRRERPSLAPADT